jgi:hypothetical protein
MCVKKLCELVKTGLLTNFIYASERSMYCDVWRDKNLCETNLCNRRLIRIDKTHAEKCTCTVFSFCYIRR